MAQSEQHDGGVRARFAAWATAESDELALAGLAALLGDTTGDPVGDRLRRTWPPFAAAAASVAPPSPARPRDPALERALATASACVGRLDALASGSTTALATAWLVRPDLAVT